MKEVTREEDEVEDRQMEEVWSRGWRERQQNVQRNRRKKTEKEIDESGTERR